MSTEPERRVELGKDREQPRVQDAPPPPEPTQRMWTDNLPPAELPPASAPGPVRAEASWAGLERPAPPAELPPYPPPPPAYPPAYPVPGQVGYGAPRYPGPIPYQPPPGLQPRYGYADNTPIWSIISFCCVAASVLGGAMLCGIPVLVTAPTGIVLGVVGHAKGEQMGKWAAIANAAVAALAAVVFVLLVVAIGGA